MNITLIIASRVPLTLKKKSHAFEFQRSGFKFIALHQERGTPKIEK